MSRPVVGQEVKVEVQMDGRPLVVGGRVLVAHTERLVVSGDEIALLDGRRGRVRLRYPSALGLHAGEADIVNYLGRETIDLALRPGFVVRQERRYARVRHGGFARLEHPGGSRDEAARIEDLSAGGMRVRTVLRLEVGEELDLAATITGVGPCFSFTCKAQVRRVEPQAEGAPHVFAGIEYQRLGERDRDRLASFVMQVQLESRKRDAG
jgi:hypothetical protein